MTTVKRITGDYNITTLGPNDNINIDTSNVTVDGNLVVLGNITSTGIDTAAFFVGDGRFLSNVNVANIAVSATKISNGFSNVSIPVASGNVTFGINGTDNVLIVSNIGANIAIGTASTSNNTGALQVTGGIGVQGNIYADAMYANNAEVLTVNSVINGGTY